MTINFNCHIHNKYIYFCNCLVSFFPHSSDNSSDNATIRLLLCYLASSKFCTLSSINKQLSGLKPISCYKCYIRFPLGIQSIDGNTKQSIRSESISVSLLHVGS